MVKRITHSLCLLAKLKHRNIDAHTITIVQYLLNVIFSTKTSLLQLINFSNIIYIITTSILPHN